MHECGKLRKVSVVPVPDLVKSFRVMDLRENWERDSQYPKIPCLDLRPWRDLLLTR